MVPNVRETSSALTIIMFAILGLLALVVPVGGGAGAIIYSRVQAQWARDREEMEMYAKAMQFETQRQRLAMEQTVGNAVLTAGANQELTIEVDGVDRCFVLKKEYGLDELEILVRKRVGDGSLPLDVMIQADGEMLDQAFEVQQVCERAGAERSVVTMRPARGGIPAP